MKFSPACGFSCVGSPSSQVCTDYNRNPERYTLVYGVGWSAIRRLTRVLGRLDSRKRRMTGPGRSQTNLDKRHQMRQQRQHERQLQQQREIQLPFTDWNGL
jgi:hypothetical protein